MDAASSIARKLAWRNIQLLFTDSLGCIVQPLNAAICMKDFRMHIYFVKEIVKISGYLYNILFRMNLYAKIKV